MGLEQSCFEPTHADPSVYTHSDDSTRIRNTASIAPPALPGLLDHCLLMLPTTCVRAASLEPNIQDKGRASKHLWFGRVWEYRALRNALHGAPRDAPLSERERARLDARVRRACRDAPGLEQRLRALARRWRRAAARRRSSLAFLELFDSAACNVRGVVVYMHGSGGMTYNNLRYARMLAAEGFVVIAPDDMAGAFSLDAGDGAAPGAATRARALRPLLTLEDETDYWADDLVYRSGAAGRLAYCTRAATVQGDPDAARALYEEVFRQRAAELDFVLARLPAFARRLSVFTMGTSEGAMTVARFDDRKYASWLSGRVISAFGVEYCYFTPSRACAALGGALDVPTLQIIGSLDEYFGGPASGSVASQVAAAAAAGGARANGFFNPGLRGHGFETFAQQRLGRGLVAVLDGARHDATVTHDNVLRALLRTFCAKPHACAALDALWAADPFFASLARVEERRADGESRLLRVTAPLPAVPQGLTLRAAEAATLLQAGPAVGEGLRDCAKSARRVHFRAPPKAGRDVAELRRAQAAREAEAARRADEMLANFRFASPRAGARSPVAAAGAPIAPDMEGVVHA